MGILTSALSNLANGLIDMGINQLDQFVTREIQEGRNENALRAVDEWENKVVQNYALANKVASGAYGMPGSDLGGGQGRGVLPVSYPGQQQDMMQQFSNLPPIPTEIGNSPIAYNVFSSLYSNASQNNPMAIQRQIESEAQKNRQELVKGMVGKSYEQNQIGFQEGLGAFDRPSAFDLTREERLARLGQREGALTTGRMAAQEPFKNAALQRSIQLKQTPGARAIGTGDNGPSGGPVSTITVGEIGRFEKILGQNSAYSYEDKATGKRYLNTRGNDVLNRAADFLSMQKKKNPMKAIRDAIVQEKADYNALPLERRLELEGRPRLGIGAQVQSESGKIPKDVKEQRQRGSLMPMPEGSAYGRTNALPPPASQPAQQAPAPTAQPQGQALTPAQISTIDAQVKNADPITKEQYRQKLKARGIDPSQIPSLR